uniref:sodium-coupled monocarboxylate transporter 2-like n=1 Tax=Ciona intestinalis TaxID=7719 RepID=UPI000EF4CBB1|nr:sodium-coupled monocarboxylate transporter 2-like [Ciona intestinalis]|eukprot:XP_026696729.1 sodium-coupled monocarboxylate transporter 2-like [Ciona intestinalis]
MSDGTYFGPVDFVVFIGMLLVAMGIGVFYAIKDRKEKSKDNYYFGGSNMSPIPLGLSMSATFISAITIIGFPTETYLFGSIVFWYCFASVIPTIVASLYYIPLVHRLKLKSIFMYLELRFHRYLRYLASFLSIFTMIFYMGNTIYIPALALNAVSPLSIQWTIAITSLVCTFYTTLGGMKAVIWTDALQSVIMLSGSLAALIKTTTFGRWVWKCVGNTGEKWKIECVSVVISVIYNRMNPDPRIRYTFWSIMTGVSVTWCGALCNNQAITQRFLSCDSVKSARIAAAFAVLPNVGFTLIAVMTGCAMYAYYETCDPVLNGEVAKPDQLLPHLVVDIFQEVPGMAGLFVSAAFSGTLSTVSSGINSLAALLLEDFILPRKPNLNQVMQLTISKFTVVSFGGIVFCFAMLIEKIGATVIQIGFTIAGTLMGPLLGVFTLGLFIPWTTWKGALTGQITATILITWLAIGGLLNPSSDGMSQPLPRSTEECPVLTSLGTNTTSTSTTMSTTIIHNTTMDDVPLYNDGSIANTLYALSYLYYGPLAVIITMLVGIPFSFITGANKAEDMNPELFVPIIDNKIFPEKVRKFFRYGVPEMKYADEEEMFKLKPEPEITKKMIIVDTESVL